MHGDYQFANVMFAPRRPGPPGGHRGLGDGHGGRSAARSRLGHERLDRPRRGPHPGLRRPDRPALAGRDPRALRRGERPGGDRDRLLRHPGPVQAGHRLRGRLRPGGGGRRRQPGHGRLRARGARHHGRRRRARRHDHRSGGEATGEGGHLARAAQPQPLGRGHGGGRPAGLRVGVDPRAPGHPGADGRQPPRRLRPPPHPRRRPGLRRLQPTSASWPAGPSGSTSGPRCTTSASATPSWWPAPSPPSTWCRAAGSSSASGPAGSRPSGRRSASTSPPGAAGWTRPSGSAGGCGARRWSSTTGSSSTSAR